MRKKEEPVSSIVAKRPARGANRSLPARYTQARASIPAKSGSARTANSLQPEMRPQMESSIGQPNACSDERSATALQTSAREYGAGAVAPATTMELTSSKKKGVDGHSRDDQAGSQQQREQGPQP